MVENFYNPLFWSEKIIAVAVLLQTIELIQLRAMLRDDGIWSWPTLRQEFAIFSPVLQKLLDCLLAYRPFLLLLGMRLIACISLLLMPHPAAAIVLLVSTILICLRWRGTFNGGSDYMSIIVLSCICIYGLARDNDLVLLGCCWYIALQTCSSFLLAGVGKILSKRWRDGTALPGFLATAAYDTPQSLLQLRQNRNVALTMSWLIIAFECTFPLAFLHQNICAAYITAALLFQLSNVYIFGLNRFLFAWAAAFPALYWCSGKI